MLATNHLLTVHNSPNLWQWDFCIERNSGNPTDPATLTDTIVYGAKNGLGLIDLRGKAGGKGGKKGRKVSW